VPAILSEDAARHLGPRAADLLVRRDRLAALVRRFWDRKGLPSGNLLHGSVSKPCTSGEHQNSWDLWMFIPLKMVLIGIDP